MIKNKKRLAGFLMYYGGLTVGIVVALTILLSILIHVPESRYAFLGLVLAVSWFLCTTTGFSWMEERGD